MALFIKRNLGPFVIALEKESEGEWDGDENMDRDREEREVERNSGEVTAPTRSFSAVFSEINASSFSGGDNVAALHRLQWL